MEGDLDPKYTEMCSSQTIQSDDQGFFGELFASVQDACEPKWLNTAFKLAKNDADKLQELINEPFVSGTLFGILEHVTQVYKKKDAEFSAERREEGQQLMFLKENKKAVILLSQAVLRAPDKGVDIRVDGGLSLALALWVRSAAFLELQDGNAALSDLQHSLASGLPGKQHGEYYYRLAKANTLIGAKAKAEICIKLAEKLCQDQYLVEKFKSELDFVHEVPQKCPIVEPELTGGENEKLKSASNNVDLCRSEKGGNFIVAKNNIKTGDVLLVERPIVSYLLAKFNGTHCLHCQKRLTAAYACPTCSGVAFCSIECKNVACSTYHKYECEFMDLLIGSGMSVLCFLALRIITQSKDVDSAIENGQKIINDLCLHSHIRPTNDYLQRCTMASFLLRILQKAEFFGRRTTEAALPSTDKELKVCEILLGLLQGLQFNAHEIYETRSGESHKFKGSKMVYIGVALYKTGSYFNHDCHPSVARYFVGTSIILRAVHPLEPGDAVGENYGPIFSKKSVAERQRSLMSRYWFKCECKSCKENWQIFDKLTNRARLRCPTPACKGIHNYPENVRKTVKCLKCKKTVSLQENAAVLLECEEKYRKAAEFMEIEKPEDALKIFSEGIDLMYTIAVPPHKNTQVAEESLRPCFADTGSVVPYQL